MEKSIFVIMPFNRTPSRNKEELNSFYEFHLKKPIESQLIAGTQFIVYRSDDTFDITSKIIRDLYEADVVICDLSGEYPNPNVMYELGVRLSVSDKPTILIREKHLDNKKIFDISGFYTFLYDPFQYYFLEQHIIHKLSKFESNSEVYTSPILTTLQRNPNVARDIEKRQMIKALTLAAASLNGLRRALASAILSYVPEDTRKLFSLNIVSFHDEFVTNIKKLQSVDWNDYDFVPHATPQLNSVASNPPAPDLITEKLQDLFIRYTLEFWNYFFISEVPWRKRKFLQIMNFENETLVFLTLISSLIHFISSTEEAELKRASKHFHAALSRSLIFISQDKENSISKKNI